MNNASNDAGEGRFPYAWYCLRAKVSRERLAVECIRRETGLEAFSPRICYARKTRSGRRKVVKGLFPGYVFVKCAIEERLRHLLAMKGVVGVVRFGDVIPCLPDDAVEELMQLYPDPDVALQVETENYSEGDSVEIVEGAFMGMNAIVKRYMPATQRVRVLVEMLGREVPLELSERDLIACGF